MNSISFIAQTVDRALNNDSTNPSQIIPRDPSNSNIKKLLDPKDDPKIHENNNIKENDTNASNPNNITNDDETTNLIIRLILFIPNLLIIRPLLFTWFIITFPLNLLERNKKGSDQQTIINNDNNPPTKEQDQPSNNDRSTTPSPSSSPSLSPELAPHSNSTIPELDEETESISPNSTTPINLKSPTSSTLSSLNSKFLTFPKFVFPRSLINSNTQKTLILDLDETLVHSFSRGTRMSNGHMVEVKLNNQVATLYYVHKRPYCDHFLKHVSKWYNLVIFTASVKEYADPVIDFLESERKYFSARYYRNHCTLRDGQGYIKDLSTVDKNLNNLIIVDNSPISYALHENNAILVEGWINDPSDSDLLNLIPLLNGVRYTTDVRALLGLKNGEVALEK